VEVFVLPELDVPVEVVPPPPQAVNMEIAMVNASIVLSAFFIMNLLKN
jgi:hypothetical protein